MAFNTQNPIPSSDPRDLFDNATTIDMIINSGEDRVPARFGQMLYTWGYFHRLVETAVVQIDGVIANATSQVNARRNSGIAEINQSVAAVDAAEAAAKADMLATAAALGDDLNNKRFSSYSAMLAAPQVRDAVVGIVDADPDPDLNGWYSWDNVTKAWVRFADQPVSETSLAEIIIQKDTKEAVFSVEDAEGYTHFLTKKDGGFGTAKAFLSTDAIRNEAFSIVDSPDGAGLSIVDAFGYHSVYIGPGEALSSSTRIQGEIDQLKSLVLSQSKGAPIPVPRKKIIAHRGTAVSGIAPENSLDAYMFSARAGYTLVETDVLKTSDSQYVIMHDDTINRTCRNAADYSVISEPVAVLSNTLADLRANYVLAADNPKHRRKIPKLGEFLAVCRDTGLHPIIELKNTSFTQADVAAIVNMAAEYLGAKGFSVTSFNLSLLDYVRTLYSDVPLYYIYSTLDDAAIDHMVAMKPACLNSEQSLYTSEIISSAHKKGVTCAAWTVGTGNFDKLNKMGLDQFATNTIAPEVSNQSFVYRNYSDADFSAYKTTGTVTNGVLTLLEGQTVTFMGRPGLTIAFGAYYVSFDYQGAGNFSGTRLSNSLSNLADDFVGYCGQAVLVNDVPTYTFTAGPGGCKIKDMRIAIANS